MSTRSVRCLFYENIAQVLEVRPHDSLPQKTQPSQPDKKKKSNDVFVIIDVTQINSSPVHSKDESLH